MSIRQCLFFSLAVVLAVPPVPAQEKKVWDDKPPLLTDLADLDYQRYLPGAEATARTAYLLNDLGLDAYAEDNLLEAARLFRAALEMDDENPFAHYNYAALLAVFAQGMKHFAAPVPVLDSLSSAEYNRILEYRESIFSHLKKSIFLRAERLRRLQEDSDFDTIRGLVEYRYLLMGLNPSAEMVVHLSPQWFSIQPGAFLPEDSLEFLPDQRVRFEYDIRRFEIFPQIKNKVDCSFSGRYSIEGDMLTLFPDGSEEVIHGRFSLRLDELGFLVKKRLDVEGLGPFSDEDSHYWEGLDA